MTSHTEYVADQDEDQLTNLIQIAQRQLDNIKLGAWVSLWVVADSANQGWFANDDYAGAVNYLIKLAEKHRDSGRRVELLLDDQLYRPQEADRLIAHTKTIGISP